RCARQPTRRASFARSGDRDSESRRPASPLLAQSCLIEAGLQTLVWECRTSRVPVCYANFVFCGRTLALRIVPKGDGHAVRITSGGCPTWFLGGKGTLEACLRYGELC